jgi:hypothetical protein
MALKAVVGRTGPRVVTKLTDAGSLQSNEPVTLRNTTVITRLDQCLDVDATNEANGSILVYNSTNDKYVVQPLDLTQLAVNLDGGSF